MGTHSAFFGSTNEDREWDDIVIGSGIGGMTCAAMLARFGHRVLVVEQHTMPGGLTHMFRRHEWRWNVGVHAVGEMHPDAVAGRLARALSDGRLEWARTPRIYDRLFYPDLEMDLPDNEPELAEELQKTFPRERVRAYLDATKSALRALVPHQVGLLLPPRYALLATATIGARAHRDWKRTTSEVLDTMSGDERYKRVVTSQWGYYGLPPSRSSWSIHASVARHFLSGCWYPVGGAQSIASGLLGAVAARGGWTRVGATVVEIVTDGERATGVRLASGEILRAKRIISNAGAQNTMRFLPKSVRGARWAKSILALDASPAHVGLYLGLRGDVRAAGASGTNHWVYASRDHENIEWNVADPRSMPPALYLSFPSLKDPAHVPGAAQLHTAEALAFVRYDSFTSDGKRVPDYAALKASVEKRLVDAVVRHMPGLRPLIAFHESSTPSTTEHYSHATRGGIYGIAASPARYANPYLRPRTPLRGLFLTGCDIGAMGVVGALAGGAITAGTIEPVKALRFLRSLGWPNIAPIARSGAVRSAPADAPSRIASPAH